jgi:4-hydroxythreonine-4-phosphate dehydrogenase
MSERPRIGITLGDPAGVGPEIILRTFQDSELCNAVRMLVIGDGDVLRHYAQLLDLDISVSDVRSPEEALYQPGTIDVLHRDNVDMTTLQIGEVQAMCGRAAHDYIERAVSMANDRELDAVVTAPINKESLRAAEVSQIGHTEILGELTGTSDPLTMFEVDALRIFFLSRHVSLSRAIEVVKKERLVDYIERCTRALEQLGFHAPHIAVAGLNPHCGEHGLFGDEEDREVAPAVAQAKELGFRASGPIGADSVFHQTLEGRYDAVLSLYHDQGHIAAKTYDFYRTVSVTLGMPILRTSVDHGTAFDIAGTGKADPVGMKSAVKVAARYAPFFVR